MNQLIKLDNSHSGVKYLLANCPIISKVIKLVGDIEYKTWSNGYVFVIHEIIEQMLSAKAGNAIFARLQSICDGEVSIESISSLTDEQIRSVGMAGSKVKYIRNFTEAVNNGGINLSELERMSDKEVIKTLTSVKGIGQWTAKMYLIFVLNRQNILPYEDGAFIQAYKWAFDTDDISKATIEQKCANWIPYQSVAARYMYRALDLGFTKTPFTLWYL